MTPTEVAAKLRRYTLWRRGGAIDQPDPREFGEAVDAAVEIIELMKVYETALREKITTKGLDVVADTDILEILDRLEAAEQTAQDYLRIDREKAQIAQRLEAAEKERDAAELMSLALRAKIEQMEKQRDGLLGALRVIAARPARDEGRNNWEAIVWESISFAEEAIALCDEPDVHPAPSVPDDILRDAVRYRFLRAAKNIPISSKAARDPVVYDEAIDAAMLAAAQEAKK